ncbi:MAG: hypothetical protein UT24_C0019G0002 [Candidatus Woesebacteria bacterium GW2011_GWB1_39_12]|uniref:Uncharacterized protein n=1 Tax=Candidatus Woesebacteria bacterium GW2011_GWB1_39_12 TaxID=1618574 RepID=A0A0G0M9N8_9BACT|nr:MAG: hypothetical protein UT24_C0019G0002 [Candidatus Woesebacteria bacterium GW2011_GWB1_39_12]
MRKVIEIEEQVVVKKFQTSDGLVFEEGDEADVHQAEIDQLEFWDPKLLTEQQKEFLFRAFCVVSRNDESKKKIRKNRDRYLKEYVEGMWWFGLFKIKPDGLKRYLVRKIYGEIVFAADKQEVIASYEHPQSRFDVESIYDLEAEQFEKRLQLRVIDIELKPFGE